MQVIFYILLKMEKPIKYNFCELIYNPIDMSEKNYWCYRICNDQCTFFKDELMKGRLRQGWGYEEAHDLRLDPQDPGVRRNLPIYNNVKKGDILLIPHIPHWDSISVAEATEDFNKGYRFEIDPVLEDFGIRSTFRNLSRFWNVNYLGEDIESLINNPNELDKTSSVEDRVSSIINYTFAELFNERKFSEELFSHLNKHLQKAEWEAALVFGLKQLFPEYIIEHVGGKAEVRHGTDVLIKMPSLIPDRFYAVAIQVKDYCGIVGNEVIEQINKANDKYFDNCVIVDKIVLLTNARSSDNIELVEECKKHRITVIFKDTVSEIFCRIAKSKLKLDQKF